MLEITSSPVTSFSLRGNSIELMPLRKEHAEGLLEAASGERKTYNYTPVPQSSEAMKAYIDAALREHASGTSYPFVIILSANQQIIGASRFTNLEFWKWPIESHPLQRPRSIPDAVEIGWTWLSEKHQRTAVNSEAKLLMLTHAFEVWKVHRVTLKTDARNERSRNAIERIGGKLDGILRAHMPAYDGQVRDTALYSILRQEWEAVQARLTARKN